jgi:hypothetical protein
MDATTCRRFASAAVTVNISLSSNTNGSDNNCSVTFPPILFTLNNTKILLEISVMVIVIVLPLPLSSQTNIDFIIALELLGTVYNGVAEVVVKSNFEFFIYICHFYPNPNQVYRSVSSFKSFKKSRI